MASTEMVERLDRLRTDFQSEKGYPFKHFFCPFLHVDEDVDHCEGHVVNGEFGICNTWVPQRKDFDSFYGSRTEADFISAVRNKSKTAFEKWIDPAERRRYKPVLRTKDGIVLDHYLAVAPTMTPGQTCGVVVGPNNDAICNIIIKQSSEELQKLHATDLQIEVDPPRQLVPAIIASVLKTAHLTMFRLLGYSHVFSSAGQYIAAILREFFLKHRKSKKKELSAALEQHFRPYIKLISPAKLTNKAVLSGTILDNRMYAVLGSSEGMFAIGVLIPAGAEDAFVVWLPSGIGTTIDAYLGFLEEPPPSIAVKLLEFRPECPEKGAHWATSNQEPVRLELPARLPGF